MDIASLVHLDFKMEEPSHLTTVMIFKINRLTSAQKMLLLMQF